MTHSGYDRLLMGSPLRRSGVSKAIAAGLLVILAFATLVQLLVFTGMPLEFAFDAVDGSSTGTWVPLMWVLLRLPRFGGANHASGHDYRSRYC